MKERPGYWLDVFKESSRLVKERPQLSADVAFKMGRLNVETRESQVPLPHLPCLLCQQDHGNLPCPLTVIT